MSNDYIKDKTVLITGGTGSLGNALTKRLCDVAKKIIIYSRCELKQAEMQQKFSDKSNIRYMIGDIRDANRLCSALRGVDICIHAACMKRVETCTYNPIEAIKSNVIGSLNVLESCIENKVKRAILVSTDKACSSSTLYGGTKFVSEQLFINGNNYSTRDTKFFVSRYGNVYGSRGSIKHIFEKQSKSGSIKVTHKDMTRFFMSMDDAVDLNIFAINNAIGGEIFIPKLKSTSIVDFVGTFFPGTSIEFIGLRGYEKIHEELISETEALYVVDLGKYYKVVPPNANQVGLGWDSQYPKCDFVDMPRYTSDKSERFSKEELIDLDGKYN